MDVGTTVVPPSLGVPSRTTVKTPTVALARPDLAKRPFESVVPSSMSTKEESGSAIDHFALRVNKVIKGTKDAIDGVKHTFTSFMDTLGPKSIECANGGSPSSDGLSCVCRSTFEGKNCETMKCFNGGELIQLMDMSKVCRCHPEEFISGPHCDVITCQNGGMALSDGSGCDCVTIYTGKFCESNIFVTNAHIGIPALVLLVFLFCCFLCRMDLCPRRQPPPSGARAHTRRGHSAPGRRQHMRHEQPPLLTTQPMPAAVAAAAAGSSGGVGAYVIRLDTIPTFNPQMIGGVPIEEGKVLEPPPPYDEALSARCTIEPPRYEEQPPEGSQVRGGEEREERRRDRRSTPR